MLTSGDPLRVAVLPCESPTVPGDLTAGPEVGSSVSGHQAEEVLGLLLGVHRDELHPLGLAELDSSSPVEVVPVLSPGEQVASALVLIVPLRLDLRHGLRPPGLLGGAGGRCGPQGGGGGGLRGL